MSYLMNLQFRWIKKGVQYVMALFDLAKVSAFGMSKIDNDEGSEYRIGQHGRRQDRTERSRVFSRGSRMFEDRLKRAEKRALQILRHIGEREVQHTWWALALPKDGPGCA